MPTHEGHVTGQQFALRKEPGQLRIKPAEAQERAKSLIFVIGLLPHQSPPEVPPDLTIAPTAERTVKVHTQKSPKTLVAVLLSVGLLLSGMFAGLSTADAATKTTKKSAQSAKATKTTKKSSARITLGQVKRTQLERDRARAKKAAALSKVSALKANRRQVEQALASLTSNVRVTSVELDKARRSANRATAQAKKSAERQKQIEGKISALSSVRAKSALDAYARPLGEEVDGYLSSEDASAGDRRQILDGLAKSGSASALDELKALQEDLEIERAIAERVQQKAQQYRSAVEEKLTTYQQARSQQEKFADSVETRLEAQLAEAAAVSQLDSKLSARLQAENASLARQLRSAGASGKGGGKFTIPSEVRTGGGGDTHGIQVAPSIRGNLARMLAAAKADGIYLTGGGYRSPANQVRLRIAHCGSSSFAIYQMRSSLCRPPTARPGNSMHERGLAIDFVSNGSTLNRSSRAYHWLRANAGRFGFKNLPSEPWHWSINGR